MIESTTVIHMQDGVYRFYKPSGHYQLVPHCTNALCMSSSLQVYKRCRLQVAFYFQIIPDNLS